jgi:hypothetical protein
MANIVISGDTSGSVTLSAPAVSGTTVLTLPTTSGTLVTTAGGSTGSFTTLTSSGASSFATSSGNVGIGTASPAAKLEVVSSTGAQFIGTFRTGDATAANNSGGGFYGISSATAGSRNAYMWLDADGANFTGSDYFYISKIGNSGVVDIIQQSAAAMTFQTSATERMRIDSSGRVLAGTTTVAGNARLTVAQSADSNPYLGLVVRSADAKIFMGAVGIDSTGNMTFSQSYDGAGGSFQGLTFLTGNTERMRINSGGNVSIGTASSLGILDIRSTTPDVLINGKDVGDPAIYFGRLQYPSISSSGARIGYIYGSGTAGQEYGSLTFSTGTTAFGAITERMRINGDGIAFINGTTSQDGNAKLQVFSASGNSAQGWIGSYTGGSGAGRANQNVGFQVGQTDLRIYADWDGNGSPRNKINVQAQSAGVQLTSGATSWASLSDEREKDIIEPITDAANKVSSLRTVIGKYKNEENKRRVFLIAQDVQAVLPEAIVIEDEGQDSEKLLLSYTDVIPLLVAAIKEQQAIITDLKTRIELLEGTK